MRLWSIHPKYLDAKGLIALWRESLLAKAVLEGKTKGYKNHPQLIRFKNSSNPKSLINNYLEHIHKEASRRGYSFSKYKYREVDPQPKIAITRGQLDFELNHLLKKLRSRAPQFYKVLRATGKIYPHPIFKLIKGPISEWEKF
ncbi:hypothetical protein JW962_01920 [Candidatus Dojkabacteria bacterium]|nr:hypothetical protein [Candidatus Dojkabacteria bacterium]